MIFDPFSLGELLGLRHFGIAGQGYCHATDGPPKIGPAGPSTANFVATGSPPGLY